MGRILAAAVALAGLSCGLPGNLERAGDGLTVVAGGLDPAMLGTFRLRLIVPDPQPGGVIRLLVLRNDLTFYAQLHTTCTGKPCTVLAQVEGTYEQKREMPNPSRAATVILAGTYRDPETGEEKALQMTLRRAWVEGSPQVSLYHPAEGEGSPYFELTHPTQLWCEDPSDCERQGMECLATCVNHLCGC